MKLHNPEQIGYLQYLYNRFGDFKVSRAWHDKDGVLFWSKHRSVMECWHSEDGIRWLGFVNNREILLCEIVFDIDINATPENMNKLCDMLESLGMKYKAYSTGSKGYHIHCFDPDLLQFQRTKYKQIILSLFNCDILKASDHTMIALENAPHWKTGIKKTLLRQYPHEQTN